MASISSPKRRSIVPAQSIDKPLSAVTEGEDVRSQRPHRFRAVDLQAVDSGQYFGDGRFPAASIGHVRSSDRPGRAPWWVPSMMSSRMGLTDSGSAQ